MLDASLDPALSPTLEVTADDKYSDDLERRRLFWLDAAKKKVDALLTVAHENLNEVKSQVEKALKKGGFHELFKLQAKVPKSLHDPEDAERAFDLLREAEELITKKGFRFGFNTAREHKQVGSSGYNKYFEMDPDVPVEVHVHRLMAVGAKREDMGAEPLSIEECDLARRLAGKTTLDLETGRITGENDEPFYFAKDLPRRSLVDLPVDLTFLAMWECLAHEKIQAACGANHVVDIDILQREAITLVQHFLRGNSIALDERRSLDALRSTCERFHWSKNPEGLKELEKLTVELGNAHAMQTIGKRISAPIV